MNTRNRVIGKVFISYSHADKRLARRIAKRLEQNGYDIWLDEKEILAGDPLSQSISEAVTTAQVVIFVVSANAVRSKWLKFELNQATGRMVQGKCRVIPVVIDDHKLPAEVAGLLYADFKTSFKNGMNSVLTALSHEVAKRPQMFYQVIDEIVREIFGSIGYVTTLVDYSPASDDYEVVSVLILKNGENIKIDAVYDTESDYGSSKTPLDEKYWSQYTEINSQRNEPFFLLVSERPVSFELDEFYECERKIGIKSFPSNDVDFENCWAVVVDVSDAQEADERRRLLKLAKNCLEKIANEH